MSVNKLALELRVPATRMTEIVHERRASRPYGAAPGTVLSAGSRLGHYEIVAAIGAGGMGEVYEARDTKLDREVAIKALPQGLAHDPERLARFGTRWLWKDRDVREAVPYVVEWQPAAPSQFAAQQKLI